MRHSEFKYNCNCIFVAISVLVFCSNCFGAWNVSRDVDTNNIDLSCDNRLFATFFAPPVCLNANVVDQNNIMSVQFSGTNRQEVATFNDHAQYTYEYSFGPAQSHWTDANLLIPTDANVTIVHGYFETEPSVTYVSGADLANISAGQELNKITMVRYITVDSLTVKYSLDTQPTGACGRVSGDDTYQIFTLSCYQIKDGLKIKGDFTGSRASYPGTTTAKFIFYPDQRSFETVHPYRIMNYRYAFQKIYKFDFTNDSVSDNWLAINDNAYSAPVKYGWIDSPSLTLVSTSLDASIYDDFITSQNPATFRIDVPAGHYFLTFHLGNNDANLGPMRIKVNNVEKISNFQLDHGCFKAKRVWITSPVNQDYMLITFEGISGANWQINGMILQALGTLNEDFTITRQWWNE